MFSTQNIHTYGTYYDSRRIARFDDLSAFHILHVRQLKKFIVSTMFTFFDKTLALDLTCLLLKNVKLYLYSVIFLLFYTHFHSQF